MRLLGIVASLIALVLLQACGGGGGSGGGNPGNGAGFTITLDRTSIAFTAFEGAFAPTQHISATARGEYTEDELFVGATVEGQGIDPNIQIVILSDTQARIDVNATSALAAGTYSGRIIFHACADELCNRHVGGTPIAVSYTVTIKRPVRTTPQILQLTSVSGAGTSGDVGVQFPDGATTFTVEASETDLHWLSVLNPGAESFTVNATSLPVGNYVGLVTV